MRTSQFCVNYFKVSITQPNVPSAKCRVRPFLPRLLLRDRATPWHSQWIPNAAPHSEHGIFSRPLLLDLDRDGLFDLFETVLTNGRITEFEESRLSPLEYLDPPPLDLLEADPIELDLSWLDRLESADELIGADRLKSDLLDFEPLRMRLDPESVVRPFIAFAAIPSDHGSVIVVDQSP